MRLFSRLRQVGQRVEGLMLTTIPSDDKFRHGMWALRDSGPEDSSVLAVGGEHDLAGGIRRQLPGAGISQFQEVAASPVRADVVHPRHHSHIGALDRDRNSRGLDADHA